MAARPALRGDFDVERVKRVVQRRIRTTLAHSQPRHLPEPPIDLESRRLELRRRAELLTMPKAAAYLCYEGANPAHAVYCFLRKHGLTLKRGNAVLARTGAIDDLLARLADPISRAMEGR